MEKKLIIYYFSGTGNARHVAQWVTEKAIANNWNSKMIDIGKLENRRNIQIEENTLVGFISPTHGFNYPPVMMKFILNLPRSSNRIFLMNTRAGLKMGKFFLPGLSGIALLFSALIFLFKGNKILGMFPVDLPSNWISLHPGLKQDVIQSIYEKRKQQVEDFADILIEDKSNFKGLKDIVQDLLIAPISIFYYLFGRFVFAKSFVASKSCNLCGLCVKTCPIKAIKVVGKKPFWTHKCESCMHCINICPERAIETAHGFIAILAVFTNLVVSVYFYKWTSLNQLITKAIPPVLADYVLVLVNTVIFLAGLMLAYRVLHFALKIPAFEKLIIYSSLTKYKFWRRYNSKLK